MKEGLHNNGEVVSLILARVLDIIDDLTISVAQRLHIPGCPRIARALRSGNFSSPFNFLKREAKIGANIRMSYGTNGILVEELHYGHVEDCDKVDDQPRDLLLENYHILLVLTLRTSRPASIPFL